MTEQCSKIPSRTALSADGQDEEDFAESAVPRALPTMKARDAAVCADAECENCGRQGMAYRPFFRKGSYIALAVCPECRHAVEF